MNCTQQSTINWAQSQINKEDNCTQLYLLIHMYIDIYL